MPTSWYSGLKRFSPLSSCTLGKVWWSKDTVYFFPWTRLRSYTHSISEKSVFFFPNTGKKYSRIFFREKDYMLLTQLFWMSLYKKIVGKLCFFQNEIFRHILRCIFFQDLYFFSLHFFFLEKIKLHSLARFKPLYFFSGTGKKNHCFYSLTRFWMKCHKSDLFQKLKKIQYLWVVIV